MRTTILSTLALTVSLAACDVQETSPQTQLDRLRVLSIRIEGPLWKGALAELAPGESATLTPLVLAPGIAPVEDMTLPQTVCLEDYYQPRWDRGGTACPGKTASVHRFWFWCPPQAATLYADPCTNLEVLASAARVFQTKGIEPLGASCSSPTGTPMSPTETACVQPPANLFDGLAPNDFTRRRGVFMSVLLVTVIDLDGDVAAGRLPQLMEKLQANSVPSVVALKRVPVLDRPVNQNPVPLSISSASGEITEGRTIGREERLSVLFPNPPQDPQESYLQIGIDGAESRRTEQFSIAWLSGFGRFDSGHLLLAEKNLYTPAKGTGIDLTASGFSGTSYPMPFVVVVRDGRGGEGWLVRQVMVPKP